ncbi:hypothetical protein F5884DRAFT_793412 [Xylogone sp. PMI_703]|nr:hypothetical protein F5884DRAFT_793412 [Xylogone sp. PMI_703]
MKRAAVPVTGAVDKRFRRQQPISCTFCRDKKLKCSQSSPCSNCLSRGLVCVSVNQGTKQCIETSDQPAARPNSDFESRSRRLEQAFYLEPPGRRH